MSSLKSYDGSSGAKDQVGTASAITVESLLKAFQKWWWFIALLVIFALSYSFYSLSQQQNIYQSQALIEIKQSERKLIENASVENIVANQQFLITQIELLQSASLAELVINELSLLSDPYFAAPSEPNVVAPPRKMQMQLALARFRSSLKVGPVGRSRLIQITFEHPDPNKAALIANQITTEFINSTLRRKFNATEEAEIFLKERLAAIKLSLEVAERKLVNYSINNDVDLLSDELSESRVDSLDASALISLQNDLMAVKIKKAVTAKKIEEYQNPEYHFESIQGSKSISLLNVRLAELMGKYANLRTIYKPKFPELVELNKEILSVKSQIKNETDEVIRAAQFKVNSENRAHDVLIAHLENRINDIRSNVNVAREKNIEYQILTRDVESERVQYDAILQRFKALKSADTVGANLIEVVDIAIPQGAPIRPNRRLTLLSALLLSSFLGVGIALAFEYFDDKIKSPEDIIRKLNRPVLAVIPDIGDKESVVESLANLESSISESYASLRINFQNWGPENGPKTVQITSTRSGEGKSASAYALALKFTAIGEKVLIIDADLRRPSFFAANENVRGLSGLLSHDLELDDSIVQTKTTGLFLITSGRPVNNPAELLSSARFRSLLHTCSEKFDRVIVDSPPVLGLADALVISSCVNATLLVVHSGILRTKSVIGTINRLMLGKQKLLGVILTKYDNSNIAYGDYYNAYSYKNNAKLKSKVKKSRGLKKIEQRRKISL